MTTITILAAAFAVVILACAFFLVDAHTDLAAWWKAHRRHPVSNRDLMVDLTGRWKR